MLWAQGKMPEADENGVVKGEAGKGINPSIPLTGGELRSRGGGAVDKRTTRNLSGGKKREEENVKSSINASTKTDAVGRR